MMQRLRIRCQGAPFFFLVFCLSILCRERNGTERLCGHVPGPLKGEAGEAMASHEKLRAPGAYSGRCELHEIVFQLFPFLCCGRLYPCSVVEVAVPSRRLPSVVCGVRLAEKPAYIIIPSLPLSSMMTLSGLGGVKAREPMENTPWPFMR